MGVHRGLEVGRQLGVTRVGWGVLLAKPCRVGCVALALGMLAGAGRADELYDFGDAPEQGAFTAPTTLGNSGARHGTNGFVTLGAVVDAEPDGQPTDAADGDDLAGLDDEDGISWLTPLIPGSNASVRVDLPNGGYVAAWMDFDADRAWDGESEGIIDSDSFDPGAVTFTFMVPPSTPLGYTFARFRAASSPVTAYDGYMIDGEVEDERVLVTALDFGDAPDTSGASFPTRLVDNGARHYLVPGVYLGLRVDREADGQPTAAADGDDVAGPEDDEDGVVVLDPLYPGLSARLEVESSTNGYLQVWLDADRNGFWNGLAEQVVRDEALQAGANTVTFTVPGTAAAGTAVMRVRFSTQSGVAFNGLAGDGEVEDLRVTLLPPAVDFGDAPDTNGASYPTRLSGNGARHLVNPGVRLGVRIDAEPDGQPTAAANGDDLAGEDDEDGVVLETPWLPGRTESVTVTASVAGYLQGWFDFNGDGDWGDAGEAVFVDRVLSASSNSLSVVVPESVAANPLMARFRFATVPRVGLQGQAADGEVEDYAIPVLRLDLGDAPNGVGFAYPVTLADDGARHELNAAVRLGLALDLEHDGQPSATAQGDDSDADGDDEDGVQWLNAVRPGETALVQVGVSTSGFLQGWIDVDRNGSWAGEQVLVDRSLSAGVHLLAIPTPLTASSGVTFARFRFSTVEGLGVGGSATDGEVEDYALSIGALVATTGSVSCTTWLQRPNEVYGLDIQSWGASTLPPSSQRQIRGADDWISDGRELGGVGWWGSYLSWRGSPGAVPAASRPTAFRVTLYADSSSTNAGTPWMPGVEITNIVAVLLPHGNMDAGAGQVSERWSGTSDLGFVAPGSYEYEYAYRLRLPSTWPQVEGYRYWLGVEAVMGTASPTYRWGWCTALLREAAGQAAMVRRVSSTVWSNLTYSPAVVPWNTVTNHPDAGAKVDLAFEVFTPDCPRLAHQWPQDADGVQPGGEASWQRVGDEPGTGVQLADEFVADGRRVAGVRWRGTHGGWMPGSVGSPTNPVVPPAGPARPLGFLLTVYTMQEAPCRPAQVLTNLFVAMAQVDEDYRETLARPWLGSGSNLQVYAYAADLLDPAVSGQTWPLQTGVLYGLGIQAVYAPEFVPGVPSGWHWLVADGITGCDSVRSTDGGVTWTAGVSGAEAAVPGGPYDLAFDLLSDAPGLSPLYEQPDLLAIDIDTNGAPDLISVGDLGSGVQVLQVTTNPVRGTWQDLQTNVWPRLWPRTNFWPDVRAPRAPALYRIEQR